MKKIKFSLLVICLLLGFSCEQEVITTQPPDPCTIDPDSCLPNPEPGSANFSKYVAIGTSISAGFQAGALFTDGQNESLGAILGKQFAKVNDDDDFDQPSINSANGFNSTFSNIGAGVIRGRLILFDPDGAGPRSAGPSPSGAQASSVTCPSNVSTPAVPEPYNSADIPAAFTGNKTALNNFSVPGIIAYQLTQAGTGNPAHPLYNGLYARFASNPGVSTILGDAVAAAPTFFTLEIGYNEVLGYATKGGTGTDPATAPYDPATFSAVIGGVFAAMPGGSKGAISTVPDVTKLPYFSLVKWNPIPMDAATVAVVNPAFAGYNQVLDALKGPPFNYSAADVDARKVNFTVSKTNPAVIIDETLNDYGDEFDILQGAGAITAEQRAALVPYEQIRQTTSSDKMTLSAGSVLGTCVSNNPQLINGVSVPLADQYVLIPSEITTIRDAVAGYNNAINTLVTNNPTRLAKADLYTAYENWIAAPGATILSNGYPVTAGIAPPLAAFSEDGVHPNGKGTAVFANVFIDAINAAFGSTINKANVTKYKGTRTPVYPAP
ncbi:MAG: hypothetical protein WAZ98_01300 [Cyclobacteriaceae bacterium]